MNQGVTPARTGRVGAAALLLGGALIAAATLFLLFWLTDAATREVGFSFTAWLIAGQEMLFFGGLTATSSVRQASTEDLVVAAADAIVVSSYSVSNVMTAVAYQWFLVPSGVALSTYYVTVGAEFLLATAVMVILRVSRVAHVGTHVEAQVRRAKIESMMRDLARFQVLLAARAPAAAAAVRELIKNARHCEGLRQDPTLHDRFAAHLVTLEALSRSQNAGDFAARAEALCSELRSLTDVQAAWARN